MPRSRVVAPDDSYMDFIRLEGQPQSFGERVALFDRPGVHGLGAQKVGVRGEPFRLIGFRDFTNIAGAVSDLEVFKSRIESEICKIYDSTGYLFQGMLCLKVFPIKPTPVLLSVGGLVNSSLSVCTVEFEFVDMGAPPAA